MVTSAHEHRVVARVETLLPDLSAREGRVAQTLLSNYPMAGLKTVAELAEQSGVSTATVLRFVKRLGFAVYADFQAALRADLEITLQSPLIRFATAAPEQHGTDGSFFTRYAGVVIAHLNAVQRSVPAAEFEAAVDCLCDLKRDIYVLGGRYSSSVGRYLVDLLKASRARVHYVDGQTQKWPHHLLDFNKSSVLVVIDIRRYQRDVVAFATLAHERGATVILLSDQWHSPVARVANHLIAFPVSSPSVFDSLAVGVVVVEALVGAAAFRLGDSAQERTALLETLRQPFAPAAAPDPTRHLRDTKKGNAS